MSDEYRQQRCLSRMERSRLMCIHEGRGVGVTLLVVTALLECIAKWAVSSPGRLPTVEVVEHIQELQHRVTWMRKFNLDPDIVL